MKNCNEKFKSNEKLHQWYIIWQYFVKNNIFSASNHNVINIYIWHHIFFVTFWSNIILFKIDQYIKSNLLVYNFSMLFLKKRILLVPYSRIFFCHEAKQNVKYFICVWFSDYGLLVKNGQQWKAFRSVYNMTIFTKKLTNYG